MYFWNKYPFVRFALVFMLGIVCYDHYPSFWRQSIFTHTVLLCFSIALVIIAERKGFYYRLRHFSGLLALFSIFYFGGTYTKLHYHQPSENHYNVLPEKHNGFAGKIDGFPSERTNYFRYNFTLSSLLLKDDSVVTCSGTIHLYIRKDSTASPFYYGDQLLVIGHFFTVPGPDNPEEFDFRQYLSRQGIYSQAFVGSKEIRHLGNSPSRELLQIAYQMRQNAAQMLKRHFPDSREQGIAEALLLGIKDHLDPAIKKAYSAAGAMHVLAVSGLHVGIIYLLIRLAFGKIKQLGKWGRIGFAALSITSIWFYALVTGMSPSVLRAATMFSLIVITQTFAKQSNVYNTLGFTAFLLLLIDPYLLYSVGFQLSFIAVLGIVYIQPKLYRLWLVKNYLLDKVWAITCVSLAAQLATFPLTAYYFHQFPTYFLISNLVVIPAAFVLLSGGLGLLLLEWLMPAIATYPGMVLNQLLTWVNLSIGLIEQLPRPIIDWIYIDFTSLNLIYLSIVCLVVGLHYRAFKTLVVASILLLGLFAHLVHAHHLQSQKEELIFYHIDDNLAIDHIRGHRARLYVDANDSLSNFLSYQIDPYRRSCYLPRISESTTTLQSAGFSRRSSLQVGQVAQHKIVIFDSTTFHLDFDQIIETDVVIIRNEAVKSLKWLTQHFKTDRILLANGNSYRFIRKMKDSAAKLDLNIHATKTDGALILVN